VERGKNPQKPFGLSKKELNQRYNKKRDSKTPAAKRVKELEKSKIENAISKIKRSVCHGIIARYVLTDSWFFSESLVLEISKIKKGAMHLLGMCKMDKRKYRNCY